MIGDAALDWWSLVHFATGALLGLVPRLSWRAAAAGLIVWEAFEIVARQAIPGGQGAFEHESLLNIGTDLALGLVGVGCGWLAKRDD